MGDWYTKVKAEFILNFVEDNRWKYLVTGLGNTLKITLAAVLLGIVIGTLVAIVRSTWDQNAERMRPGAGKSLLHIGDIICKIYLTVIRGTPVVVQLMIMYLHHLWHRPVIRRRRGNARLRRQLRRVCRRADSAAASWQLTRGSWKPVGLWASTTCRRCALSSCRRRSRTCCRRWRMNLSCC